MEFVKGSLAIIILSNCHEGITLFSRENLKNGPTPLSHQVEHFLVGFIGEPMGQLYASENDGEFIIIPFTLKQQTACYIPVSSSKNCL
jgi:hypothetical protein